jgi:hypothetical protein
VYHLVRVSTQHVRDSSSSPYAALSLNCPYKTLTCISKILTADEKNEQEEAQSDPDESDVDDNLADDREL